MKYLIFSMCFWVSLLGLAQAQITPIATARTLAANTQVTVTGIVKNGAELGGVRYITDATGSIALFGNAVNNTNRGDSIIITGRLDQFFGMVQLTSLSGFQRVSQGNPLPEPLLITPAEMNLANESKLVRLERVVFDDAGSVFQGNETHGFTSDGQRGVLYTRLDHPLVGRPIPFGETNITAINSVFSGTYQLLPRDSNDIEITGNLFFTSIPRLSNQTTGGFDLSWTTNLDAIPYIAYGPAPDQLNDTLVGAAATSTPLLSLTGFQQAELVYARPFSVADTDTALWATRVYITASASTGDIQVFFNLGVDSSRSTGTFPQTLTRAIDDTLIAYINRAHRTIDFMTYNINNSQLSDMTAALNNAHARGVRVRVIANSNTANLGLNTLNAAVPKIFSPDPEVLPVYGIMHNKVLIIDGDHPSPDSAIVWTGSTNFTRNQINFDPNNVIVIQDQALAKAYTMEFEEMWGGSGDQPTPANAKFGADKSNNTPHEFTIGGRQVELYFSPTDNTTYNIIRTLNTTQHELDVVSMSITRSDLARTIEALARNNVEVVVLTNDTSGAGQNTWTILDAVLADSSLLKWTETGTIMHHKYAVGDYNHPNSDPFVITGSHNWSNSANNRNDENTLIIYDAEIANWYHQEAAARIAEQRVRNLVSRATPAELGLKLYPNPTNQGYVVLEVVALPNAQAQLLDLNGRTLVQQSLQQGQNRIEIGNLTAGVYLLSVQLPDGRTAVQRVVVQ